MKKAINLKFFALSTLLMLGNVFAFAQDPAVDQAVGTTLTGNVVTYRVNAASSVTVSGEKAYPVTITGLDADGLDALGTDITLNVPVTFREKLGEEYYRFYVTSIKEGSLGNSFYGYTEIKELNFVPAPGETDEANAFVPFSEAANKYTVGNKAFYGCSSMTKLTFTSNCSSIGEYAFQNTAITSFEIPAGCGTISKYAFYNCKSLLTVTVASGNTSLATIGNYVFGNSSVNTVDLTNASALTSLTGKPFMYNLSEVNDVLKEITLPASLTTIDATVFQNCTYLQKVNGLQATAVATINDASFLNCRNLTQLDLPNADIVNAPFVGCAKLATLTFPDGYNKEIGKTLAANTNLYGTTDIVNAAYSTADQGALTTITFKGTMLGKIASKAFMGSLKLNTLTFTGALCGGATIDESAFQDVTTLATVTFNGIKTLVSGTTDADVTIGEKAFQNIGIAALDFKGIELEGTGNKEFTISANAFSDCAKLADIQFGDITVKNDGKISIMGEAFTNETLLAKVTFGVTTFTAEGKLWIYDNAFGTGNIALAEVAFGKIVNSTAGKSGTFYIGYDTNFGSWTTYADDKVVVFGDGKHLQKVTFDDVEGGLGISAGSFASTGLKEVKFGAIKAAKNFNSGIVICHEAFKGGDAAGKAVEFGAISDGTGTGTLTFVIQKDAFTAESLKSVKFADIAAKTVTIEQNAFQGKSLETVTLGNITAANTNATVTINEDAFLGGEVADKTVTIGNIVDNGTKTLSATIGKNAFSGKLLKTLKIGDMTATSIAINGENAFANLSETTDDAMAETIEIGEINAGLNITGTTVFQGPQADGSALTASFDKISGAATIPASTFVAPAKGTAAYTVKGDVVAGALANVKDGAFVGSQENVVGTPEKNTTSVKFQGDFSAIMTTVPFTNVNDVEIAVAADGTAKNYHAGAYAGLWNYAGAKSFKIGDVDATTKIHANGTPNTDNIEEVTFLGSFLGELNTFNSTKVRKIAFTNVATEGVKVAAGAIKAGAFDAAATAAAAAGENITVIYKEEQTHDEAVNIFERNAFVATAFDYSAASAAEQAAADANIVTLYTTTWCKANVFEAADNDEADLTGGVQKKYVWRLGYSESTVAPGDDIVAKVAKPEGYEYAFGKIYIPKGKNMKYRIKSEYDESTDKNAVQLYYGQIDNSNSKIYMYQLPIINDYFWIDATDVDQAFVIRTNKAVTEITAEAVTEAMETEAQEETDNFYYFNAALAVQNQLRYATAKIVNQELRNNAEFKDRAVYMMANPATKGFAFAKIDKTASVKGELRYMPANSLYIVAKNGTDVISAAPELEVVWVDDANIDANTTGIEEVKNAQDNSSDAIYNLQGVRVSKAQKGIFIMNGKKVVIK